MATRKRSYVGALEKEPSPKEAAGVYARTPSTPDHSQPDIVALLNDWTTAITNVRPDLESLLAKWKKILSLQDWDVKINYVRAFELPHDKGGTSSWVAGKATCLIKILDPADYPTDIPWPQDIEGIVVHELLHIHFAAIDDLITGNLAEIVLEQAINRIEAALTSLDRAKQIGTQ